MTFFLLEYDLPENDFDFDQSVLTYIQQQGASFRIEKKSNMYINYR